MRERRVGYNVKVVPSIIGALGGGMSQMVQDLKMILENNDIIQKTIHIDNHNAFCEMQKTILMDSENMVRKVIAGLIQDTD